MDVLMPVLLGFFVLIVMHFSYYGSVTKQIEPGISDQKPVYVSQVVTALENKKPEIDLPEIIKKDRTVEHRHQWEWKQQWIALVRDSCTEHYGKDQCNNCEAWDHSTPYNCSCDVFVQKNFSGEICLSSRSPDPFCDYHSKDHHFA